MFVSFSMIKIIFAEYNFWFLGQWCATCTGKNPIFWYQSTATEGKSEAPFMRLNRYRIWQTWKPLNSCIHFRPQIFKNGRNCLIISSLGREYIHFITFGSLTNLAQRLCHRKSHSRYYSDKKSKWEKSSFDKNWRIETKSWLYFRYK